MDQATRDWLRLVGGVVLAVGMVLIFARKDGDWAAFPLFLILAAPCAALLGLATAGAEAPAGQTTAGPAGRAGLAGWQSTYLVTGILLLLLSLLQLAVVLGADSPLDSSGTSVWVFTLTAAAAGYLALELDSRVNTLLGALAIAIAGLAFIDWVGPTVPILTDDPSYKAFRWVLIIEALAFLAAAMSMRDERPDHGDYLVDAAGVTAVAAGSIEFLVTGLQNVIGAAFVGTTAGGGGQPNFWEFFLLAVSLALIAYAAWRHYRGTAYIGFIGLILFAVMVGGTNSIGGWPIILAIAGALGVAAGLVGGQAAGPGPRRTPPARPAGAPEVPPPPPGAPPG